MEKVVENLDAFNTEVGRFVRNLKPRTDRATLVTLSGELGAGKTAFVKAAAGVLGVTDVVNSPTFVFEKIYSLPTSGVFKKLVHIDAYRLEENQSREKQETDLQPLGFDEVMKDSGNIIMLEWPERIQETLPPPDARIALSILPGDSRKIIYG